MKKHNVENISKSTVSKKLPSQQFSLEQVKQLRTEANAKPKWGYGGFGSFASYVR